MCIGCALGSSNATTATESHVEGGSPYWDQAHKLLQWCLRGSFESVVGKDVSDDVYYVSTAVVVVQFFVCTAATCASLWLLLLFMSPQLRRKKTLLVFQSRALALINLLYSATLAVSWCFTTLVRLGVHIYVPAHETICSVTMYIFSLSCSGMFFLDMSLSVGVFAATTSSVKTVKIMTKWFSLIWIFSLLLWAPSLTVENQMIPIERICFPSKFEQTSLQLQFGLVIVVSLSFYVGARCKVRGRAPNCVEVRILTRTLLFCFSYIVAFMPMITFMSMPPLTLGGWFPGVAFSFLALKPICDAVNVFQMRRSWSRAQTTRSLGTPGGSLGSFYNVRFDLDGSGHSQSWKQWFFPFLERESGRDSSPHVAVPGSEDL